MNTTKLLLGSLILFAGIMLGAGEMPDASAATFLLEKLIAFVCIGAGFLLIENATTKK